MFSEGEGNAIEGSGVRAGGRAGIFWCMSLVEEASIEGNGADGGRSG